MPDKQSLVGLQKLAAANSNVATRHVLQAGLYLTLKTAEAISLRVSDVLQYGNTTQAFVNGVGKFNVASLREIQTLHLHDFGIFLELAPDEEQKQILENNIQMALQQKQIEIEDAIDAREVKNLKLANQLLKLRRKKKFEKISGKKIAWDYENKFNPKKYLDSSSIDVKDNVVLLSHRDCLKLFGYKSDGHFQQAWWDKGTKDFNQAVWFPKLYPNKE